MTNIICSNCKKSFILPRGQRLPTKCVNCLKLGTFSTKEQTWSCQACGTSNGVNKKACQGCNLERLTRRTTTDGVRAKPDGDIHTMPRESPVKRVKSLISDD